MTIEQLFALLFARIDSGEIVGKNNQRIDSTQTAFLRGQLEQIRSKVYDVKRIPLKARTFLPKATDIASGTQVFKQYVYDFHGMAKIITSGNARDLPRADVRAFELFGQVYLLGSSFGWNYGEIQSALLSGQPLSQKKTIAAMRAIEEAIDSLIAYGAPTAAAGQPQGILHTYGMLNMPNVPDISSSLNGDWDGAATPDEVLTDLFTIRDAPFLNTKTIFTATTMLLAPTWQTFLARTVYNNLTGKTILQTFLDASPGFRVDSWQKLETAGTGGIPRTVCYTQDAEVAEAVIPSEFTLHPMQQHGLEYETPCTQECGGVTVHHPMAFVYADVAHA